MQTQKLIKILTFLFAVYLFSSKCDVTGDFYLSNKVIVAGSYFVYDCYNEAKANLNISYSIRTSSTKTSVLVIDGLPRVQYYYYTSFSSYHSSSLTLTYSGILSGTFCILLMNDNLIDPATFDGSISYTISKVERTNIFQRVECKV